MRGIIKIAIVLLLLVAVFYVAQPIINKDTASISNIEELESIEGIRKISTESNEKNITLKIIVENDLSENEAREKTEEVLNEIDVENKRVVFSLLYEHGYLIGQGSLDSDNKDINWD